MKLFTTQERNVIILLIVLLTAGLAVKELKKRYYSGSSTITYIGSNQEIVDYYAGLDEEDIQFAGLVDIKLAGIEELSTLPGVGEKTTEKNINKRNELGGFSSGEDLLLVPGIGNKTYEKISPHIRIN